MVVDFMLVAERSPHRHEEDKAIGRRVFVQAIRVGEME